MLSLWYFLMSFTLYFSFFLFRLLKTRIFWRVKDHRMFCDRKDQREYLLQYFHFICVEIAAQRGKINFQRPYSDLKVYSVITRMIWILIQILFHSLLMTWHQCEFKTKKLDMLSITVTTITTKPLILKRSECVSSEM